jgi:hypothetical protein
MTEKSGFKSRQWQEALLAIQIIKGDLPTAGEG